MSQWRNEVRIKEYLGEAGSDELVKRLCEVLIPQLKRALDRESRVVEKEDGEKNWVEDLDYFNHQLEELIEEFEWISEAIEQGESTEEYAFNDWVDAFDEYLESLYELGDNVVKVVDGFAQDEKYLWVK